MCAMPFSVQRLKSPFFSGSHDQLKHGDCVAPVLSPGRVWYWNVTQSVLGFLRHCGPYLQDSVVTCRHHGGGSLWAALHAAWVTSPFHPAQAPVRLPCSAWLLTPHSPSEGGSAPAACLLVIREARGTFAAAAPTCTAVSSLTSSSTWERACPSLDACSCAYTFSELPDWGDSPASADDRRMSPLPFLPGTCRRTTDPWPPWLRVVWAHLSLFRGLPKFPYHLDLVACRVTSLTTLFCLGCRKHLEEICIHSLIDSLMLMDWIMCWKSFNIS